MTAIEKVLLRKDIASLIVAIVVGSAVTYFLATLTSPLSMYIGFADTPADPPLGRILLQSVASFALQVVALELLLRLVIAVRGHIYKKAK